MGRPRIVTAEPVALPEHELLARVFRTLGDATRLRLLEALALGDATQSELLDYVEVAQPRVSEHLGYLTWCGLITAGRQDRTVTYRVVDID